MKMMYSTVSTHTCHREKTRFMMDQPNFLLGARPIVSILNLASAVSFALKNKERVFSGKSGMRNNPAMQIGMLMMPSMMNSHCHPALPSVPLRPL